jgi:acetyl esterase
MNLKKTLLAASALLLVARWATGKSATGPVPEASMQKVLDALKQLGPKPIENLSPAEARLQPLPGDAVKAIMAQEGIPAPSSATSVTVTHREINGAAGSIPLHIYTPQGTGPFPVLLYFHGGGFVIAETADYDASPRALAEGADVIVVAVDYHRAPEFKFPHAPNDAWTSYQWVRSHAAEFDGDPTQIAVGGESAGGNLATVVSMMARDRNQEMPLHQLLIYPLVDNDMSRQSYRINANAAPLNRAMMHWFFRHYADERDLLNPYALPMKAGSLADLPDATIITAEIDPLRSEGKAYAARLLASGVAVSQRDYPGVTHEFFGMGAVVPAALEAEKFACECLKQAFTNERFRLSRMRVLQGQSADHGLPR